MIDPLGDLWLLVLLRDSFQKRCFIHEFIKTKSACFVKWCALSWYDRLQSQCKTHLLCLWVGFLELFGDTVKRHGENVMTVMMKKGSYFQEDFFMPGTRRHT